MPTILAIESSCDDTSASVIRDGEILSNVIVTQEIHDLYGGVVPEVASRAHQQNIVPAVQVALDKAKVTLNELEAIAVTNGPGLMGSLLVGVSFAKALALSLDIKLININHMEAHVLAHFIEDPKPKFPFLNLTVSGGHTQIVLVKDYLNMGVIGSTLDDAAGEAFDKSGKLLGLGYPAGPRIDKLAKEGLPIYDFPEPQIKDLNFSFSGLKTSIANFISNNLKQDPLFIEKNLNDICASIQSRIISILINKLKKAAKSQGINEIGISGGVSANSGLRKAIQETAITQGWNVYIPKLEYCTDNAAMIAIAAHYKFLDNQFADQTLVPFTRS